MEFPVTQPESKPSWRCDPRARAVEPMRGYERVVRRLRCSSHATRWHVSLLTAIVAVAVSLALVWTGAWDRVPGLYWAVSIGLTVMLLADALTRRWPGMHALDECSCARCWRLVWGVRFMRRTAGAVTDMTADVRDVVRLGLEARPDVGPEVIVGLREPDRVWQGVALAPWDDADAVRGRQILERVIGMKPCRYVRLGVHHGKALCAIAEHFGFAVVLVESDGLAVNDQVLELAGSLGERLGLDEALTVARAAMA